MASREQIEQKTEHLLKPIMDEHHFELVDVEYVKEGNNWYLRAYIDKDGGITIDNVSSIKADIVVIGTSITSTDNYRDTVNKIGERI